MLIPGNLGITHVDASLRVAGEKLDANGTRSIFIGYKSTKNELIRILDGGIFLISPHITAYESTESRLPLVVDPREVVRSFLAHVRKILKFKKRHYVRNED